MPDRFWSTPARMESNSAPRTPDWVSRSRDAAATPCSVTGSSVEFERHSARSERICPRATISSWWSDRTNRSAWRTIEGCWTEPPGNSIDDGEARRDQIARIHRPPRNSTAARRRRPIPDLRHRRLSADPRSPARRPVPVHAHLLELRARGGRAPRRDPRRLDDPQTHRPLPSSERRGARSGASDPSPLKVTRRRGRDSADCRHARSRSRPDRPPAGIEVASAPPRRPPAFR